LLFVFLVFAIDEMKDPDRVGVKFLSS